MQDMTPLPSREPDEQTLKAREKLRRELNFLDTEASLAHEFGHDFDPGDEYRELRRKVIEGVLTHKEALALHRAAFERR